MIMGKGIFKFYERSDLVVKVLPPAAAIVCWVKTPIVNKGCVL